MVQIPTYRTIRDICLFTAGFKYRADSVKELWDAISSPEKVQVTKEGDCDEIALYVTNVIDKSIWYLTLDRAHNITGTKFMTVTWLGKDGFGGHNVCLIEYSYGTYSFMDYFYPYNPRPKIEEVVRQVIDIYGGNDAECLGWFLHDKHLNYIEGHWK